MKVSVLKIRPTQMAVGMREVDRKLEKLRTMKKSELIDYLKDHRIPVVLGPEDRVFLVDHHHLSRACWELGMEELPVDVLADMSKHSWSAHWKLMKEKSWVHLFDQFGNGPHDPIHLPESIKGLADDPYRSLAWMVREKGGYEKTDKPFCEFRWADFFRKSLKSHPGADEFDGALKEALELAHGEAAKGLPGFLGAGVDAGPPRALGARVHASQRS